MISRKFRLGRLDTRWLLKKGGHLTSNLFIVRYLKFRPTKQQPQLEPPKFTVIASTKLAKKAVDRNTIKRRVYEAIRLNLKSLDQESQNKDETWKVALIPKKRILDVEYKKIEEDIQKLFAKLARLDQLTLNNE
ncbi:MAG: ribonuclease P protein component [Candidatus Gracilibacteria bacterium]